MNLFYADVATTPVHRSEYSKSETNNIDLTSDDLSMFTGFTNASKLFGLENIITSRGLDRISQNRPNQQSPEK
jgi:hypothetical protein